MVSSWGLRGMPVELDEGAGVGRAFGRVRRLGLSPITGVVSADIPMKCDYGEALNEAGGEQPFGPVMIQGRQGWSAFLRDII